MAPSAPPRPKAGGSRLRGNLAKIGVVLAFSLLTIAVAWRVMVPPAQTATETPPAPIPTLPDATRPVTPTSVWMEPGSDPSAPTWSPDGQFLAFEVPRAFGAVKIQVATIDRDARAVLAPLAPDGTGKQERFRLMQRPVWTQTDKVMFEGTLERSAARRLYEAGPQDATATQIVSEASVPGNLVDGVDWKAERVALVALGMQDSSLFLLDRRSKRVKQIADQPGAEHLPSFSSDGSLWYSRKLADDDLYRYSLLNSRSELVAKGPGDQNRAVGLPGNRLAFYSSVDGRVGDVVLWDPTAGTRNIATNVHIPRTGAPSVSPDGQWLFWVDAGVPELIMATAVESGKTVKIRPGVGVVDSPVAARAEGRTRVGFLAGNPGGVGVYVADVTDALVAPPLRTVDKQAESAGAASQ